QRARREDQTPRARHMHQPAPRRAARQRRPFLGREDRLGVDAGHRGHGASLPRNRVWNRLQTHCRSGAAPHLFRMLSVILQNVVWVIALGAVVFWPAGTFAYPGGWAFEAVMLVGGIWISLWLYQHDPALLKKRLASPLQKGQKPWDRLFLSGFMLLFVA